MFILFFFHFFDGWYLIFSKNSTGYTRRKLNICRIHTIYIYIYIINRKKNERLRTWEIIGPLHYKAID